MEPRVLLLRIGLHGYGHHFGNDCRTWRYMDRPRGEGFGEQGASGTKFRKQGCGGATRLTSGERSGAGFARRHRLACGV
jgi:hypothetical protein